jgi:chromosome segregation ATPase
MSSPLPVASSAAHLAHLQDLQHQVSVKQLALQTLQREYESLLQKLERQRIKSQALEKKFEVSDAEINNLTDDKERLAGQVQALEGQVEELQLARDEARKMGADSAAQYMKIVEMAGRLQGKGVEDRKLWEKERGTLLKRIMELEGGPTTSLQGSQPESSHQSPMPGQQQASPIRHLSEQILAAHLSHIASPSPQSYDTATLRQEILELKDRIQALETALKEALDESKAVREATLKLASISQRLETSAASALGATSKSEAQQQHF